jgi:hypothetical protein
MDAIKNVINELTANYPNYKFTKARNTYSAVAIINIKTLSGNEDLAYYGGDSCGYCVLDRTFYDIKKFIQAKLPEYKVIDFINGCKSGSFEIR